MIIDSAEKLKRLFEAFDKRLDEPFELYAIGGANLLAQGLVDRPTEDVDVISPPVLPERIDKLIQEIARRFGLALEWLNTGPSRDERFLSKGWKERCSTFFQGEKLTIHLLGRKDMVGLKLTAALDRAVPDVQDLMDMNPTDEEWEFARLWARAYDANVDWPAAIDKLVTELKDRQRKA